MIKLQIITDKNKITTRFLEENMQYNDLSLLIAEFEKIKFELFNKYKFDCLRVDKNE